MRRSCEGLYGTCLRRMLTMSADGALYLGVSGVVNVVLCGEKFS